MIELTLYGRTDDGADALLRHPSGQVCRYPDPERRLDDQGSVRLTFRPGRTFAVRKAGSFVFFRSPTFELALPFYDLLPALPERCDIDLTPIPGELNEGADHGNPSDQSPAGPGPA